LISMSARTLLALVIGIAALSTPARAAFTPKRPLVVVHYMPWFEAKPASGNWGWHWTMNFFDPDKASEGRRQIASHYYPLIGPYDSGDAATIEYHLLLMKLAGIDGVIVDWYGTSDFQDYPTLHRNTVAVFKAAKRLGLRFGICYEDQTIPKLVEANRFAAGDRATQAQRDLEWMRQNWFGDPAYLRLNGKPVLLSFGSGGLSDVEWTQVLHASSPDILYLSEHRKRASAAGSFDWPRPEIGTAQQDGYNQVIHDKAGQGSTVYVPVAFPRFQDIYKEARVSDSFGSIADDQGRTFAHTLDQAWKSGTSLLQIATWNDWGEGTVIEPSKEFGYRDLETLQKLRHAGDAQYHALAEDLRIPYRVWLLRAREDREPQLKSRLDTIVHLLVTGDMSRARSALKAIP